jgi:hypothetical protein
LIFGVFKNLGVSGRAARFWMWFLPLSYGCALQAGSLGNDLPSVVYALAGVRFALDARRHGRVCDALLALVSTALLTGVKASNLPLLLPLLIVLWPARGLLWRRPLLTGASVLICAGISFLPIAAFSHVRAGHWTGDPHNTSLMRISNSWAGLVGNSLQLFGQSLTPPVFPMARRIEPAVVGAMPGSLREWLRREFPRFSLRLGELPQEESSGFGLGCSLLLAVLLLAGALRSLPWYLALATGQQPSVRLALWVSLGGLVATLAYMAKLGSEATARLLQPYYPIWILLLALPPASALLHRRRWWNVIALAAGASTLLVLALTPARPLFPAEATLHFLESRMPGNAQVARAREVFAVYATRNDALAPLRRHLPQSAVVIGYIGGLDDTEYALWRPFGARRVVHLFDGKRIEARQRPPMEWVVVKEEVWREFAGVPFEQWLVANGGERVAEETIVSKVSAGPERWWVARFAPGAGAR